MPRQHTPITEATGQAVTSRRGVLRAAAWATPAVVVATAAPAFARSTAFYGLDASSVPDVNQLPELYTCFNAGQFVANYSITATKNGSASEAEGGTVTFSSTDGILFGPGTSGGSNSTGQPVLANGIVRIPAFYVASSALGGQVTMVIKYETAPTQTLTFRVSSTPGGRC